MKFLSRRTVVGWLGSLTAAAGLARRASAEDIADTLARQGPQSGEPLPPALTLALAEAVLPTELGATGISSAATRFRRWLAAYREGAEVLHPYGSTELRTMEASPAARWRSQLRALDTLARERHQRSFARLAVDDRRTLVREALSSERVTSFPAPHTASHIAVGLLAWFYDSADATDLCYQRQIGKNQCRPLVNSSREPLPLARPLRNAAKQEDA